MLFALALHMQAQHSSKIVTDKIPGTNCDNTAVDEFVGALNRSATPCEIEFDRQVRSALRKAFDKLISGWSGDWIFNPNSNVEVTPVKGIDRGSERYFYQISVSDAKDFYLELNMNPAAPQYREWISEYSAKLDQIRTNPENDAYKKFAAFNYFVQGSTNIRIRVSTNDKSNRMIVMKGGSRPLIVPGAAYAVRASYVAPLTGGTIDESMDAAFILFGNPKVKVNTDSEGLQGIEAENVFPSKTSHLTTQQIAIRIECNTALLDKVLKAIDFSVLQNLIGK